MLYIDFPYNHAVSLQYFYEQNFVLLQENVANVDQAEYVVAPGATNVGAGS